MFCGICVCEGFFFALVFFVFLVGPSCCYDHFGENRGWGAVGDRGLRVGEEIQRRRGTGLAIRCLAKGG